MVDTMVAVAIIGVAVIGTSRVRYCAALDSRRGTMQVGASQTAVLLCESWRAVYGIETYDPITYFGTDTGLVEYDTLASQAAEDGFTQLGSYRLVLDNSNYYVTLAWKDVSDGLRALNAIVTWSPQTDQGVVVAASVGKSFSLTTYALRTDDEDDDDEDDEDDDDEDD